MKRRKSLQLVACTALSASVAGCIDTAGRNETDGSTDSGSGKDSETDGRTEEDEGIGDLERDCETDAETSEDGGTGEKLATLTVTAQDTTPDEVEGTFSVEVINETVTTTEPGRLCLSFVNTGPKRRFFFWAYPPFTEPNSNEMDPGAVLLRPDEEYETVRSGCWQPDLPESWGDSIGYPATANYPTLETDGSIARTVEVWGDPGNNEDVCLPAGEFRFEQTYDFEHTDEFTWGFSVSIQSTHQN